MISALINDLALFVHYFVVLQNVLTNFAVALLNRALRTFNRLGDHFCFDRFVIRKRFTHDPTESTCCKQAHEFVIKTEIEATFTRVALTTRTTAQLIVDTT